ncbi:MAG TPA: L,D-transpeptidase family protein, partial [Acidimicrobiales bacterium]|nr:L,D-transpeptidase family protein [Acidimicrobiales bacterium]
MRATASRTLPTAVLALALVATAACSGKGGARLASASPTSAPPPSTTTTEPPTTTTEAPTTTAKPAPPVLAQGSRGPEVQALEARLAALHYDVGAVDGVYDSATYHAVMAFEKVTGLARTGKAPEDVVAAVQSAGDPPPLVAGGGATRVEVDLKRQVLFLYKDGALLRILSVSTGSGQRYCVQGVCDVAVTPGGSFRVGRKIKGLHISPLGQLWNPLFFNGGIAIHGAPSVPATPASHGCVRIPMNSSAWFFDTVAAGTPVYVV